LQNVIFHVFFIPLQQTHYASSVRSLYEKDGDPPTSFEMASEIAAEAAQNTNVVWMIEFQEHLVERLYKKMISLVDDDAVKDPWIEPTEEREADEENS
jgi:hypothetical protein